MSETVLCLNSGSSSIKFQVYDVGERDALSLRLRGQLEGIGVKPYAIAKTGDGKVLAERKFSADEVPSAESALPRLLMWIRDQLGGALPIVIGHRVVFGGPDYAASVIINDQVIEKLTSLVPLMPLHLPPAVLPIKAIHERVPNLKQVAVFDTGFHRGHAEIIERLPLPDEYYREGVRRYGFHGISYEYIAGRLPEIAPEVAHKRVLVAHLGSGCSMCAMVDGRSVECSMGFSALDGLPMGTRPGRLDPGVLLYMLQVKKMTVEQVQKMLFSACGLKGLSGISNDVRELLQSDDPRAKMTLEYFCLACARMIADFTCVMGGIDGLVFTAGVGEHAAPVRSAIASRLEWLGLKLDAQANARHGPCISARTSNIACYVIPTNEELMIARHALQLVRGAT